MPEMSDTQIDRAVERVQRQSPTSRHIENGLAIAGLFQAMLYGTIEALAHAGIRLGPCAAPEGFPWVTLCIFAGCVAPKTLGRATAGKLWEKLPIVGGK